MNYPYLIPGSQGQPEIFASNISGILGSYDKPVNAKIQLEVDYSLLPAPPLIASYSFEIKPGGEPQLRVSASSLDATETTNALRFVIEGGIAGRTYTMVINVIGPLGGVRSDVLTINVLGDYSESCQIVQPVINNGATSPDGSLFVNTAPRLFVSSTFPNGAHVMDQWYNSATGALYYNTSNGSTSYWVLLSTSGSGGGGGGGSGSVVGIKKIDPITPDGTATTFNLAVLGVPANVVGTNYLFVSVDGVWQQPTASYTAIGATVTFVQAPSADSQVFMMWFTPPPSS